MNIQDLTLKQIISFVSDQPYNALSLLALVVTILSFLFLYILAKRRGTKSQLSTNLIYAVIAVLFSIGSDKLHWWVIISICLSIYLLLYPLRYLRIYLQKAWKWVFIGSCALLAGGYALDTLQVYLSKFKLIALALWLVSCVASLVFVWLNSEGHKCPKCSRFIVPINIGERTDCVKTHKEKRYYKGQYLGRRTEKSPYGNKVTIIEEYAPGHTSVYNVSERKYTEFLKCPICGHEHSRKDTSVEKNLSE